MITATHVAMHRAGSPRSVTMDLQSEVTEAGVTCKDLFDPMALGKLLIEANLATPGNA